MEKEGKNNEIDEKTITTTTTSSKVVEPEFVLQWGKRIRCVRFKEPSSKSNNPGFRRKISSRIIPDTSTTTTTTTTTTTCNDPPFSPSTRINSCSRVADGSRNGKLPSPEKGERYYSTRGSMVGDEKENGRLNVDGNGAGIGIDIGREDKGNLAWPKLYIALSSKEKEEDFLAMKGCKLPQRPKKRAKLIQRTLLLVSPGAWLPEMSQERYEVREKKTPRKRPRGLKAMGSVIDSDSE